MGSRRRICELKQSRSSATGCPPREYNNPTRNCFILLQSHSTAAADSLASYSFFFYFIFFFMLDITRDGRSRNIGVLRISSQSLSAILSVHRTIAAQCKKLLLLFCVRYQRPVVVCTISNKQKNEIYKYTRLRGIARRRNWDARAPHCIVQLLGPSASSSRAYYTRVTAPHTHTHKNVYKYIQKEEKGRHSI